MNDDFRKYATKHLGMNGLALDKYIDITSSYISPTIIEERQMNVAQMDVFSRLMMDRIIFLGTQIDDYAANVIQAQLLYLDSSDPGKDISIYLNTPGGSVYAGLGIYDTMQYISTIYFERCLDHLHGYGSLDGCRLAGGRNNGQTFCLTTFSRDDSSADGGSPRASLRYRNYGSRNTEIEERTLHHHCQPFGQTV